MTTKKLNCILLIDDDNDCNFFHQRLLKKMNCTEHVQIARNGMEALKYLTTPINGKYPFPDIIFLDINMPRMNGWEFLEEYKKLDLEAKGHMVLLMLTTSLNPDDLERSKTHADVDGFKNKFLNKETLEDILQSHFSESTTN